jgi:hypothetical protein
LSTSEARRLDPLAYCDACEETFRRRGSIGQCDHDFPGRPLRRFWTLVEARPREDSRPRYLAAFTRAATFDEARKALRAPPGRQVSLFVTWWLFPDVDGGGRGERLELELERMPSAYDEWSYGPGAGHNFRAMEEAGKEVT